MYFRYFIFIVFAFLLSGCSVSTVSEAVSREVEEFLLSKGKLEPFVESTFQRIDWNFKAIENADSIIYPFTVVWGSHGRDYPFKHQVVVKADTIVNIEELNSWTDQWNSLIPIPYDVRKEDWWIDLAALHDTSHFHFDKRSLVCMDTLKNRWVECFTGNIAITDSLGVYTLKTDSLIWNPLKSEFTTGKMIIESANGTITGNKVISDPYLYSYTIPYVTSGEVYVSKNNH
ncbi:MAG: hypothetical protein JKY54_12680 [Flavobacteriales bacterium]|nr:hypothetical protein [Flavobacteriales bacterium]